MLSYFLVCSVGLIIGFAMGGLTAENLIEDDYEYYDDDYEEYEEG